MPAVRAANLRKQDYEALAAFRRALRRFMAFSEQAARAARLTPQQHQVLLTIKGAPGREVLSVGEIAAALMIRPHSAVELIDRLVQIGLAERQADAADHRRVNIALTGAADAVLEDLSVAHLEELRRIRPALAGLLRRFETDE
jgi:DNA-binding MarR family transcriptional regulator